MRLATPHRLLLSTLALCAALAAPVSASTVNPGELLVTSDASNTTGIFAGTSGVFQSLFAASFAANGQMAVHFHPTNGRVLIGHSFGGVEEFDGNGNYIKTYNPGGSWQWAGIYAPSGEVLIGDMGTNDIRRYDATTGAFIAMLTPVPGPADMEFGPNGNLYVCSFLGGVVFEIDPTTGGVVNSIVLPGSSQPNDVAWNPANGEMLISDMRASVVYRFTYPGYAMLGSFAGSFWITPHGIAISPHSGRVLAIAGNTGQVHEFDPVTYTELDPTWLSPDPGNKIVDLAFAPGNPTPAEKTSWGRIKSLYRK